MSDADETIAVAQVSEGPDAGRTVELPVLEVLTGRAFLTGKSGSGKSNSISVVAERLLDQGFGLLVVDIEGEYYGLKEEYEILHAGADDECDIQVSEEHAGKLASLALEQNVPIILDLSGFLHEQKAQDVLTAVARQLFAKEKKIKQPFLLIVEEIHEYVPEGGGLDECGRMLIKVAKRGRKHGLGIAGISQRPADVKKDFITQCDWLVWHRLTWQNDTRVVKRVLGNDYADAVEDLGDGEGFLMTDWSADIRKVQFDRKETFDAGATPGLDDFERPDLKSVSGDLVSELQRISEDQGRREDRINDLEARLEEREQYVAELEEELAEARDLSRMAEQFAQAMTRQAGHRYAPATQPSPPSATDGETGGERVADEPPTDGPDEPEGSDGPDRIDEAITAAQAAAIEDAVAAQGDTKNRPDYGDDPGRIGRKQESRVAVGKNGDSVAVLGEDVDPEAIATGLAEEVDALEERPREMLARYREVGIATPEAVHESTGGSGERADAYRHNRTLRTGGFVVHVGRGRYAYALPSLLDALAHGLADDRREELLEKVEAALADE